MHRDARAPCVCTGTCVGSRLVIVALWLIKAAVCRRPLRVFVVVPVARIHRTRRLVYILVARIHCTRRSHTSHKSTFNNFDTFSLYFQRFQYITISNLY